MSEGIPASILDLYVYLSYGRETARVLGVLNAHKCCVTRHTDMGCIRVKVHRDIGMGAKDRVVQ